MLESRNQYVPTWGFNPLLDLFYAFKVPVDYRPILKRGWGPCLFLTSLAMAITVMVHTRFYGEKAGELIGVVEAYTAELPDFTIRDGRLRTDVELPYVRMLPQGGVIIVDHYASRGRLAPHPFGILVTDDRAYIKQNQFDVQEIDFAEFKDREVGSEQIREWLERFKRLTTPVIAGFLIIVTPLLKLLQAGAVGILAYLVVRGISGSAPFTDSLKAAFYALLPALTVDRFFVWSGLEDHVPYFGGLYYMIAFAYTYLGIRSLEPPVAKRTATKGVDDPYL